MKWMYCISLSIGITLGVSTSLIDGSLISPIKPQEFPKDSSPWDTSKPPRLNIMLNRGTWFMEI